MKYKNDELLFNEKDVRSHSGDPKSLGDASEECNAPNQLFVISEESISHVVDTITDRDSISIYSPREDKRHNRP